MDESAAVLQDVARWLAASQCAVAFTGAGISTESGIPDFRSPGGFWSVNRPVMFDDFCRDRDARKEYWRQKCAAARDYSDARPNPAHEALARWETQGRLRGVITQNIDELHQQAGSRNVLELHGTACKIACLDCAARFPLEPLQTEFMQSDEPPTCPACGGLLKHATISFGQALPQATLEEAARWCCEADLMLAMGSSLVVTPAAELPRIAAGAGARLVIINREETPLDHLADAVIRAALGPTLTAIDALLPHA
ncbi:MAG: Sir2 family NAD-dependent protein deacetylase [Planctomycetales bacterium]|nr:Sir2 family NAD-dependent protein deacetylase [Planctomycetales bacterium]